MKRLNRGLIAFLAVLIIVVAYLLVTLVPRKAKEKEYVEFVKEYVITETRYRFLPEEYRTDKNKFDSFVAEMKSTISGYYDDKNFAERLTTEIEKSLISQREDSHKYSITITPEKKFPENSAKPSVEFDGKTALVTLKSTLKLNEEDGKTDKYDLVKAVKIGDSWKLIYAATNMDQDYYGSGVSLNDMYLLGGM